MLDHTLTEDELGWLIGLATARRRKREESLARMSRKPGQTEAALEHAFEKQRRGIDWARSVEDHLIRMLGDRDPRKLRPRQYERYLELGGGQ